MATRRPRTQVKSISKPKNPKPNNSKPDNPKPENPKTDNPKPDNPKPEEPKPIITEVQSIIKKVPLIPGTTMPLARPPLSYMEQVKALKRLLDEQLIVCDAKFAMFFTAARTYDYEYNLHPHPPMYSGEISGLRIDMLLAALQNVPPLKLVRRIIDEKFYNELDAEVVELLYWLFVSVPQPPMRLLSESEFAAVLNKVSLQHRQPTQAFLLGNKPTPVVRTIQTRGLATRHVFAATKFGHVHVIMHSGFKQQLLVRKDLNAIFVFWKLSDAIEHSYATPGWGASECGSVISCVVLCELAMDPKFVTELEFGALVSEGELLTPRYLLFYAEPREVIPPPEPVAPVRIKPRRNNVLYSVLIFSAIMGILGLKEFFTLKEISDGFISGIQRLFEWV